MSAREGLGKAEQRKGQAGEVEQGRKEHGGREHVHTLLLRREVVERGEAAQQVRANDV